MVDHSLEGSVQTTPHERGFDASAAAIGPLAAAARGLWVLFAISAFLELVGLILAGRALIPAAPDAEPRGSLWAGIILIVLARILVGVALRPLTDIFALPGWLPGANVFSLGDVLIGVGVAVVIALGMREQRPPTT